MLALIVLSLAISSSPAEAQSLRSDVTGRVVEGLSRRPLASVFVTIEGASSGVLTDSLGNFTILGTGQGPHVLIARRVGYAPLRVPVNVGARTVRLELLMERNPLRLQGVQVTAEAVGRGRGEVASATVVERDAIANQSATSLAGVLELVPGTVLAPPGLDGVQQFSLRAVPTSGGGRSGSAADVSSFGTLIILDGVPLSNNANLQSGGPQAELGFASSAGGGIDLRRIPAATLERVEVIRGIPSVRYGDLTQGAIIVDTRAGAVPTELLTRYDSRTVALSAVGGRTFASRRQTVSATGDVARTKIAPGVRDDAALRVAAQLAHSLVFGEARSGTPASAASDDDAGTVSLDSRVDAYQLLEDSPEQPTVRRGRRSWSRDNGFRVSERLKWIPSATSSLTLTSAVERIGQNSFSQSILSRGPQPFSGRLAPGRDTGFYVGGEYLARVRIEGAPWHLYNRAHAERRVNWARSENVQRIGGELRREWNSGAGYQFAVDAPPQSTFDGVRGYLRPRRYDQIAPLVQSAAYADHRLLHQSIVGALDIQGGVRVDVLHAGSSWFSAPRSVVFQPRLSAQLSPGAGLRFRASGGRTAKAPSLAQLSPAPAYFDLVNVNYFANDPAERLAIVTTSVRDQSNAELGYTRSDKLEIGAELDLGRAGATLSVILFSDQVRGATGSGDELAILLRERFSIDPSSTGSGSPPRYLEPAQRIDTLPVFTGRAENNVNLRSRGVEATVAAPEIAQLRTRLELQAAWITSRFERRGIEIPSVSLDRFRNDSRSRIPFYDPTSNTGQRGLATWRIVHHQPDVGLVVTTTIQHTFGEATRERGATDTLAFAGFLTREGTLIPVARELRAGAQYADLRVARPDINTREFPTEDGWILNLQVAKALPYNGRVSLYAFNALSRLGRYGSAGSTGRLFPPVRFGMELSMPLTGGRGGG